MKKIRTITDVLMIILLPMLMAYSLIGEKNHELIGISMFVLFAAHHVLNRRWWASVFRGRYSPARAVNTGVDLLLALYMVMQPVSGILMSKHVLTGVTLEGASSNLRAVHMALAYWGFVLLSVHMGLHAGRVITKLKKKAGSKAVKLLTACAAIVSAYGIYAFIRRGIADYLFFRVQFAFFDPAASKLLFMLDYAAVIVLIVTVVCLLQRCAVRHRQKN